MFVPVPAERLHAILEAPDSWESEELVEEADFTEFDRVLESLAGADIPKPRWDEQLVEPFHLAMEQISEGVALDMRLWHWLSCVRFQEMVRMRWLPASSPSSAEVIHQRQSRFLGNNSLQGISRNALARLWWAGQTLYSVDDGYDLAIKVFANQDLFQGIFEREIVLHRPAARAMVRELHAEDSRTITLVAKRLNQWATTIAIETLDECDIRKLVREGMEGGN